MKAEFFACRAEDCALRAEPRGGSAEDCCSTAEAQPNRNES